MKQDLVTQRTKLAKKQNKYFIKAALEAVKGTQATHLFLYVDAVSDDLIPETLPPGLELVLVTKKKNVNWDRKPSIKGIVTLPVLKLGRLGLIKMATVLALSSGLVHMKDSIVFLSGKSERELLDILITFQISAESEIITVTDWGHLSEAVKPPVFEHALNLAIELANKGREGKPVGTIFVLGDEEKVLQLSRQMIINPFKGYSDEERNLLNPSLHDTLVEFSALDGAFVISGDGQVMAAGRYLGAASDESEIPRGLGARHIAASGITALTNAIAIVISESTGNVRIFKGGKGVMSIEK